MTRLELLESEPMAPRTQTLAPGAVVLRGHARGNNAALLAALHEVLACAPLRHMLTPGGLRMSVAMTNCGALGWTSGRGGYRYATLDPLSGSPWPRMPQAFALLATHAAAQAGFANFAPDACLVNRYEPGARLTLHQDRDERDLAAPIVSVSLGVPAVFLFGGPRRTDKTTRIALAHGDVVVWGGPARLHYHGVMALRQAHHPFMDEHRINLTLRKAA